MIEIDYSRDKLLDPYAVEILKERYMLEGESSPQEAFARAAVAFCAGDYDLAQRIYDYSSNLWFMYATPVLSNAPKMGEAPKGMPISCFLNYVPDSREGLAEHYTENIWLASMGGGIGGCWSDIRSDGTSTARGSKSTGSMPFLHVVDAQMLAVAQGTSRRGAYAAYMNISHPEVEEFIGMRDPTGGDVNRRNLNLHHGVNITDDFMQLIEAAFKDSEFDDSWSLIDPHSKEAVKTVRARDLWEEIVVMRMRTGEPYIHFIDTTNRLQPDCHKSLGLKVKQSNLCTEILLPTNEYRTAVCCLSSVNLEYYDDWKNSRMVEDLVVFLDNVLQYFIDNAPKVMEKAIHSAKQERSIGIGAMGFHSYLQSRGIPFESSLAISFNRGIFQSIRESAEASTEKLGLERGNAPDYEKTILEHPYPPRRNVHLLSVAPNASSSIICGNTSPSIEPFRANGFSQKTLNGTNSYRNKHLVELLRVRVDNEVERANIWKSIFAQKGSVQHLDFLTDDEKKVYKCAPELDQMWVIEHASHRQGFIDQGQSVNLFFAPDVPVAYLHRVHLEAWRKGLKTLYYCRTESIGRPEDITQKFDRYQVGNNEETCIACEG